MVGNFILEFFLNQHEEKVRISEAPATKSTTNVNKAPASPAPSSSPKWNEATPTRDSKSFAKSFVAPTYFENFVKTVSEKMRQIISIIQFEDPLSTQIYKCFEGKYFILVSKTA